MTTREPEWIIFPKPSQKELDDINARQDDYVKRLELREKIAERIQDKTQEELKQILAEI